MSSPQEHLATFAKAFAGGGMDENQLWDLAVTLCQTKQPVTKHMSTQTDDVPIPLTTTNLTAETSTSTEGLPESSEEQQGTNVAPALTNYNEKTYHHGNDTSRKIHKAASKGIPLLVAGPVMAPLTNRTLRDEATKYLLLHQDLKGVTINYKKKSLYFHTSINPERIYNSRVTRPGGGLRQHKHEWHDLIVKN
jgi:hypothetical protein